MPNYFDETTAREIDDVLQINIHGTLRMTRAILPIMLKRSDGFPLSSASRGSSEGTVNTCSKNGLILNIGSFAGYIPSPMLAVYSGSKAFLSTWSQALADEYKSRGIVVQLVNTYFVVRSRLSGSEATANTDHLTRSCFWIQ